MSVSPNGAKSVADLLREQRQLVLDEAERIAQTASQHQRAMSSNEATRFDELMREAEQIAERAAAADQAEQRYREGSTQSIATQVGARGWRPRSDADAETVEQLRAMLLEGRSTSVEIAGPSRRGLFNPGVEARALSTTAPANMTPVSFADQIFENAVANASVLNAGATVIVTETGEPLRVPRSTARSTAGIVNEGATIPSSDPTLGSVTLGAFKLGFLVIVSRELLTDTGVDLQGYLARQAGQAIGVGMNNLILNGTGGGTQPAGVIPNATVGVTGATGMATSLGNQTTAGMGTDALNNLAAAVPATYLQDPRTVGFLTSPSALAGIKNIKATTGELIGNEYLAESPYPFYLDDNVPVMAANAKSILFGDWSRVVVRVAGGLRFERSDDFRFDTDQVAFRALVRFDSALANSDAVKYFQNSAT